MNEIFKARHSEQVEPFFLKFNLQFVKEINE